MASVPVRPMPAPQWMRTRPPVLSCVAIFEARPERLSIARDPEVGDRECFHRARNRLRVEGLCIRRRVGADLLGPDEAHDGLESLDSNLLPRMFQGLAAPGHAVKPEAARDSAWERDWAEHPQVSSSSSGVSAC